MLHQRVAQVGALVAAVLPGAPGRLAEVGGAAGAQRPHRQRPAARHRLLVALVADDHQAAAARGCAGRGSASKSAAGGAARPRQRQRALRLLLVGDADRCPAGPGPGPARGRSRRRPRSSPRSRPRSGAPRGAGRTRTVTSGITPSTPSEPTISSRRAGPAAVCGVSRVSQLAGRGEQADRADQRVEAPVAARGLAGRAGRGEAADRRVLEGLREVAEGQALARRAPPPPPARAGRRRGARSASGGRPSTSRSAAEVEADQALVGAAQRLDPADDAGAAAEGDDGDALAGADVEDPAQRLGVGRAARPRRAPPRARRARIRARSA